MISSPRWSTGAMVCAVDHLAAGAGLALLRAGGSAVDAAVGTSAVLAVTSQHLCGIGGDLLCVVAPPGADPVALDAVGTAGSGADLTRLAAQGHTRMPFRHDIRAVTVPGCIDGWLALHHRFGRLPLGEVLASAVALATDGFPVSPGLADALPRVIDLPGAGDYRAAAGPDGTVAPGAVVRRPGLARTLGAVATEGRHGFYGGAFGAAFLAAGGGEFTPADLEGDLARWSPAISLPVWGATLWTSPPVSQGYLTLASAWLADQGGLANDPDDPAWAAALVTASRAAGRDRLHVLHDGANGAGLLAPDRLSAALAELADPVGRPAGDRAAPGESYRPGDTTAMCVVDAERCGVSLIQSNASGFGSHITVPELGIFLHNRGIGFSLDPASPAAYGPRRRPPHTLSPLVATGAARRLRLVAGTMGGDAQPQILLQLLARTLVGGQDPAEAVAAGRFVLAEGDVADRTGFGTWNREGRISVMVEGHASPGWAEGLARRHHVVEAGPSWSGAFGHAHLIRVGDDLLAGGSDSRAGGAVAAH